MARKVSEDPKSHAAPAKDDRDYSSLYNPYLGILSALPPLLRCGR